MLYNNFIATLKQLSNQYRGHKMYKYLMFFMAAN